MQPNSIDNNKTRSFGTFNEGPNTQEQIDFLKSEIESLKITRDLPIEEQDAIKEIVSDGLMDIMWKNYFHYSTFFESLDGIGSSAAPTSVAGNRLFMSTSGTNDVDYARKAVSYQNMFSFDRESRFRSVFGISSTSITSGDSWQDSQSYVGTGAVSTGFNNIFETGLGAVKHYGVYIDENVMYGVTSNGDGEYTQSVIEDDVKDSDLFMIEMVHHPRDRVDFYVSQPSNVIFNSEPLQQPTYRGSISTNLPIERRNSLYEFSIKNVDGATGNKDMDAGFCEIAQRTT